MKTLKKINPYLLLTIALLVSCLIIYALFVFGDNFFIYKDIGSDSMELEVPGLSGLADNLRRGTFSFWEFGNGFGKNTGGYTTYDPFSLLICVIGAVFGLETIPYILIYVHILKIIFAGVCVYYFLDLFNFSIKTKLLMSYIYAFNGFIIVWGQHYSLTTACVYIPLLFAAVEMTLHNKKKWYLISIVTFLICIFSLYFCYMSLITVFVYFLIRLLVLKLGKKKSIKMFFTESFSMLLGIGLAGFSFFSGVYNILMVSSRTQSSVGLLSRILASLKAYPSLYYETFIHKLFSNNFDGTMSYYGYQNFCEATNIFCSCLTVLLIIYYFISVFRKDMSKEERTARIVTLILMAFVFFIQTGGLIYNGFVYAMSRWTFAVIPVFILLGARALEELTQKKTRLLYLL